MTTAGAPERLHVTLPGGAVVVVPDGIVTENIHAKIAWCQSVIPTLSQDADVNVKNQSGQLQYSYRYIKEGALADLHRSVLPVVGVASYMRMTEARRSGAQITVTAELTLVNVTAPDETVVITCDGEAVDPSDKGRTKAFTTARRLLLGTLWLQGGEVDSEQDDGAGDARRYGVNQGAATPPPPPPEPAKPDTRPIDARQLQALTHRADEAGLDDVLLRRLLSYAEGAQMPAGFPLERIPKYLHARAMDLIREYKKDPAAALEAIESWEASIGVPPEPDMPDIARPSEEEIEEMDERRARSDPDSSVYQPDHPLYTAALDPSHPDHVPFDPEAPDAS